MILKKIQPFSYFLVMGLLMPIMNSLAQTTTIDFETGNINGWTKMNIGAGIDITQEDKHAGNYALKVINGSGTSAWSVQVATPPIHLTTGNNYKVSFWIRAIGGGKGRISTRSSNQLGGQYWSDFNVSNEWSRVVYNSLIAGSNSVEIVFDLGYVADKTYFIDDILVEDLTPSGKPLASEHSKFLGNIVAGTIPSGFKTLWNQVTAENGGKWGSVESKRDVMNWTAADLAYNFAKQNGYQYKYHTLVWGNQQPGWLTDSDGNPLLTPEEQLAEIEEYMQAVAKRYPDIDYIDVVNEPIGTHAAVSGVKQGLGGNGRTGWDWVIKAFQLARNYFPQAKLHINDYHIMAPWGDEDLDTYLVIIKLLNDRELIDGIGIQSHQFNMNQVTVSQIKSKLSKLAQFNLPIYVTELDITGKPGWESDSEYLAYRASKPAEDEETQYQRYKDKFPVFWEHPSVAGMTLWGYVEGATWTTGSGLINADGTERKAMTWLREYMESEASKVPNKFITSVDEPAAKPALTIFPNPVVNTLYINSNTVEQADVYTMSGIKMLSRRKLSSVDVSELPEGMYLLRIYSGGQVFDTKFIKK